MVYRMLSDTIMLQIALLSALMLRFLWTVVVLASEPEKNLKFFWDFVGVYLRSAGPLTIACLVVFCLSGFYTYGRSYQSRYKILMVVQAVTIGFLLFSMLNFFFKGLLDSRSVLPMAWFFSVCLLVATRISAKIWVRTVGTERRHEKDTEKEKAGDDKCVLVIGGAGYIGSALIPMLLDDGYKVRLFDLLLYGTDPIKDVLDHPNLEVIEGDFRRVDMVVEAMRGVDAVVHLGAIVGDPACDLDESLTIEVNLVATRWIAEIAKGFGVERFVFASTCSVYGGGVEILDERSIANPVSLYGRTKLAAEHVLLEMASHSFKPTIVRFATLFGLSGRTRFDLVVNLLAAKAKVDGEITVFGGDQWRPFVHVHDAARALRIILDAPGELVGREIYNVGSDELNYQIHDIGEMVLQRVVTAKLFTSDDVTDPRNYRVSFHKIASRLGYQTTWTVEEGIEEVLEALSGGNVEDYRHSKYSNVKFLSEQGTDRLVSTDKDWSRRLVEQIPQSNGAAPINATNGTAAPKEGSPT